MKATWNNKVIAESSNTVVVEGNHYFPLDSLKMEYFTESKHTSVCGWKGTANYMNVVVDGKTNENAVWVYKTPKAAAQQIKEHYAFWKGVSVN
jgi:uncharacterized protein (DUF427 family)